MTPHMVLNASSRKALALPNQPLGSDKPVLIQKINKEL
jgi:hypothetical protein